MKDINQLLDEIEERANFKGTHAQCVEIIEQVFKDVPALVKALRRAIQVFQLIEVCDQGRKDDPDRVVAVKLIREWIEEIAAILNQK